MNAECIKVLLVEDNPGDARLVEIALSEPGPVLFKLDRVGLLSAALRRLEKDEFELILLDLSLPDSHGLDTVISVRKKHQDVPIVVLTGLDNETNALEALRIGAQDYLVKGTATGETLRRTIRYAIERRKILKDLKNHQYISEEDEREILDVLKGYRVFADSDKSPFVATTSEKEPLSVRMPKFVEDMSELYKEYFDAKVCEKQNESAEIEVDALIERLVDKGAGPRDIMAMHLQCMEARQDTENKKNIKSMALQGQFIALEIMGHLVNAYRKNGHKVKESV